MPISAFYKFDSFVEAQAEQVHNLGSDELKVALSDVAPVAGNTQLSNITEISYTNISSRVVVRASSAQAGGIYKLICDDLTLTASGDVGPFRYVVLYNNTATNKELIGYWIYPSELTMHTGELLLLNFDQVNGIIQEQ